MTEQRDQDAGIEDAGAREGSRPDTPASGTGDPGVDAIVRTLDRLRDLSTEEHLPLFEEAHEALRRALNRPAEAAGSEG